MEEGMKEQRGRGEQRHVIHVVVVCQGEIGGGDKHRDYGQFFHLDTASLDRRTSPSGLRYTRSVAKHVRRTHTKVVISLYRRVEMPFSYAEWKISGIGGSVGPATIAAYSP